MATSLKGPKNYVILDWSSTAVLLPWINPENLVKIGPVDFEIIASTEIVKNYMQGKVRHEPDRLPPSTLRTATTLLKTKKVHDTTIFLLVILPNTRRFCFFTDRLSNKPFLNLVIYNHTTPMQLRFVHLLANVILIVNRLFSDIKCFTR